MEVDFPKKYATRPKATNSMTYITNATTTSAKRPSKILIFLSVRRQYKNHRTRTPATHSHANLAIDSNTVEPNKISKILSYQRRLALTSTAIRGNIM